METIQAAETPVSPQRKISRTLVAEALAGVLCPLWMVPLGWYLAYHTWAPLSWLGFLLIQVEMVFLFIALWCAIVVVFAPIWFFVKTRRKTAAIWWAKAAIFLATCIGGLVMGLKTRHYGVVRVTSGAEFLVRAIHNFEAEKGRPPASLNELLPVHLSAIPRTGIGSFPQFRYITGPPADWDNNPWVLQINPPNAGIGFDTILYFPLQNYPRRGYGGSLQRVGTWAYVHE